MVFLPGKTTRHAALETAGVCRENMTVDPPAAAALTEINAGTPPARSPPCRDALIFAKPRTPATD